MKTIKTKIHGIIIEVIVREFNGMYQIVSGVYTCGLIRKDEVL